MPIVVMDYSDGCVHIINEPKNLEADKIEPFLSEKFNFKMSNIEWMFVQELEILNHGISKSPKAQFKIDEGEILDAAKKKLSRKQVTQILSFVENDEGIWSAIEQAKNDAINFVLSK